jgi:NAD(P)H-nitrite reductase large subunit
MAANISRRYVIIGNGIAGTTCAQMLRKNDVACEIDLITNEPYPLYNRVSLPRFLQGVLTEEKVMIRNRAWHEQQRINLMTETMVQRIDAEERVVYTDKGQALRYDALLVATGGWANPLRVPGAAGTRHIYNFVTLDDTKEIIARTQESTTAVAVGGSFIAYELAEGMNVRGLHVTWLIRGPRWLRYNLDEEGGALVDGIARKHNVDIIYGEEIREVIPANGVPGAVVTTSGRQIPADMIGVGLGLTLNTRVLAGTGVETRSGVVVNEYLETNVPGIYSAGDVAEFYDPVLGRHHTMGTWDNAAAHGRVVAQNMAGAHEPYVDVPTYTSPLFNTTIAFSGSPEANNPDLTSIARTTIDDKGNPAYRKFFFRDDQIVGAIFIGGTKGRKTTGKLIKANTRFVTPEEKETLFTVE